MSRCDVLNALAVVVALAVAVGSVLVGADHEAAAPPEGDAHPVVADGGAVVDATGARVPVAPYHRVASLSLVSDHLALEWCDPGRVVAFSAWSTGRDARRMGDAPRLEGLADLEAVLAVDPDLVLLAGGDAGSVARLRERGIAVFDLGPAHGLPSLQDDLAALGRLLGHAEEARRLAASLAHRLSPGAAAPDGARPLRTLVLHTYADQLFGGTRARDGRHCSYHDVVVAAGLHDVAAGRFAEPWPRIPAELVVELMPELIVTREGQAAALRRHPALRGYRGRFVELPGELWDHPGPPMATCAELLGRRVHAER